MFAKAGRYLRSDTYAACGVFVVVCDVVRFDRVIAPLVPRVFVNCRYDRSLHLAHMMKVALGCPAVMKGKSRELSTLKNVFSTPCGWRGHGLMLFQVRVEYCRTYMI